MRFRKCEYSAFDAVIEAVRRFRDEVFWYASVYSVANLMIGVTELARV